MHTAAPLRSPWTLTPLAWATALALSGCATLDTGAPTVPAATSATTAPAKPSTVAGTTPPTPVARPSGASSAAPGSASSGAAPAGAPGQPQAFAVVSRDAKRIEGLFPVWQKEDKVWIELAPADFNKPFFFGPKISQGIGENGYFGGTVIGAWAAFGTYQMVEFRRVHNQVQLVAKNARYKAAANTPEGRAVDASFSPSLLGSSTVASQPHPERKTILVELNSILLSDLLGMGINLQRTYRQGYSLDRSNSAITQVRGKPGEMIFQVQAHFATNSLAQAQGAPGASPVPQPTLPRSLPDARSLFMGLHYAFSALPEQPMAPRKADPRIGHFTTNVANFSDDLARTPQERMVRRWRLEKKDPNAAVSEPVKPITFWLDRTIPLKYRDAIAKGVTGWNVAFEKIGFKNALVVKVQPDDADFDTLDMGAASIRWMTNAQPQFGAIGPSQADPRTGEILDADIGFEAFSSRNVRATRAQVLGGRALFDWSALMQLPDVSADAGHGAAPGDFAARPSLGRATDACTYAAFAAEQLSYAMDVLEARGDLDPNSPEAEQWVLDYLTDVSLHEVGHTLGLRHNYRSSRIYTNAQMNDPAFVKANGLAGSVMEYSPVNLAAPGQPRVPGFQTAIGPYDYWAIEYAYTPMPPGSTAAQEAETLQRIASRSADPALAYGTDEDNSFGIDPESLVYDIGNDPVAFASQRVAIARELFQRQATRELPPTADYSVLRRSVTYGIREMARAGGILTRQIGGLRTLRDFPGSGRDPLQPTSAAVQRQALDLLGRQFFAADAVVLPAALQRRLAPDFMERTDALFSGEPPGATDFSLSSAILGMQRALLTQLLSDGVAERILDAQGKLAPGEAFTLAELYDRLLKDVWSELEAKSGDIAPSRRELQRDHATRLASVLLRPGAQGRGDARALLRLQAQSLLTRLEANQKRAGLSKEAQAHLADSAEQLRQALQARIARPA